MLPLECSRHPEGGREPRRVRACAVVVSLAVVTLTGCGPAPQSSEQAAADLSARGCGNGVCSSKETCSTCPADCGACPPSCGDRACNGTETCITCPGDCGPCPTSCGDGFCNGAETCGTCVADCGACPSCGDGACNGGESCTNCPNDCGTCPAVCGDHDCWPGSGESCSSCPADCGECPVCGDGVCTGGESCSSCAADCGTCPVYDYSCTTDADCFPNPSCYPTFCVSAVYGYAGGGGACNADCPDYTLTCGQGYCACENSQCTAKLSSCGDGRCDPAEVCICSDDCACP
jgi:hypothetical protein